jgi:exodeoxyribonuclease V beta subunit
VSDHLLEPLSFPLQGRSLIEASAGTGKTWTIAALYLRLVLGHGGAAAFPRALTPPQILVVTFTEAATKELRDRIRARLAEAAAYFLEDPATALALPTGQDLLHDLRASYPSAEWPAHARVLRLAAEWMDEAAVSTIHGWCNRMLREHAFDSGSLFTQTLEADQADLIDEALRDYWRTFFYPLPEADARCVGDWWATPVELGKAVRKLLEHADRLEPALPPMEALQATREENAKTLAALKAPWPAWADDLEKQLDAAVAAKRVDGRRIKGANYKGWLNLVRAWAKGADPHLPLTDAAWARLTVQGIAEGWKVPPPLVHDALHATPQLRERLACLPDAKEAVLRHATRWVAARLADEQERRARMGFNDLLTQLSAALHGPNGPRLAQIIRAQFPVALIDEFQDTDPVQYGIFNAIYGSSVPDDETALVLIGDPKQAIYAFRGADIQTYLQAKRDTAGRHATLGTNFRSTQPMVAAVNRFFGQAEEREAGQGAFLFRTAEDNPLPFVQVEAAGRKQHWSVQGTPAPALTCWWLYAGATVRSGDYTRAMAAACATEVVRLLRLGQQGQAGFAEEGQPLRALKPGDIAVLVNNRNEARELRKQLKEAGVRSVYLSDSDNVYASAAAGELQRLLQACAEPDDDRLLRAALGCALLGLSWVALDRLNHDELHWEEQVLRFRGYRQQWRRQGVLPMVRRLLHEFGVPQRLVAANDERQLTDVLHLAELLQQASVLLEGEHALVRHLSEAREEYVIEADVRQVRLESDENLLKVVTVHKSKGLEYPLVFAPFVCNSRPAKLADLPVKWHDDDGHLHVAAAGSNELLARVDDERLGEDLRKLYVALTRARFATWIGFAPLDNFGRTAAGYLLTGGAPVPPGQLQALLLDRLGACDAIAVVPAPTPQGERYEADSAVAAQAPERPLPRHIKAPWWIASYSALRVASDPLQARIPGTALEDTYLEAADEAPGDAGDVPTGRLHDFPRGAGPGSFLHGLLEWAGREGFRPDPAVLHAYIASQCQARNWPDWAAPLQQWLAGWLDAPLRLDAIVPGAAPMRPADLQAVQVEMEFWFSATHVEAAALDALVTKHTLGGVQRPALMPKQLHGMLKGFMDLVFEHEGRYYVADYKSNHIADTDAGYTPDAMRAEILKHRYELQYALYLFALHRLLRTRIADYDYDTHIGGAVYIFLRGHASVSQGLHLERPPRELVEGLDRLFSGADVEVLA